MHMFSEDFKGSRNLRTEYCSLDRIWKESVMMTAGKKANATTPWTCRNTVEMPQLSSLGWRRAGGLPGDHTYSLKGMWPSHCSIRLGQLNPKCCKNSSSTLVSVKHLSSVNSRSTVGLQLAPNNIPPAHRDQDDLSWFPWKLSCNEE